VNEERLVPHAGKQVRPIYGWGSPESEFEVCGYLLLQFHEFLFGDVRIFVVFEYFDDVCDVYFPKVFGSEFVFVFYYALLGFGGGFLC
jgi:hypothetical protein